MGGHYDGGGVEGWTEAGEQAGAGESHKAGLDYDDVGDG